MSNFQYKNPLSPIQVLGAQSVSRTSTFGTNFSILGTGGYMEVYGLTDLNFVIPVGQTGFIEFSGNTIPIEFNKGTGTVFSPDVVTLNSDNMSSGRRRLGMLVYVYETNKIYRHTIENYGGLWSAATDASGVGGPTVVISDFGTTVKNNSVAGQNLINAWTGSTIEGVDGYTNLNATWRELVTGSGGTSTADTFVTGFTLSSNTITLTQNRTDQYSSFTISLSAYTGSSSTSGAFLPLSGGTVTGNTIFNSGLTANTLTVTGNTILSGLTATTISATTYLNYPDTFVTGFTLSSNTITLTQNRTDGYSSFTISLSAYTGNTSFSGDYLPLSGGTVTGNTIFQSGLTANTLNVTGNTLLSGLTATTISATTYQNLPVTADTFVTGFTLSSNTLTISQNRLDQYSAFTISLSAYTGTSISGLYLPLSGGTVTGNTIFNSGLTANTLNVTGDTLLSGLTASTISATTYQNVNAVTGGTYSNGTITLSGTGNFASSISGFPTTFINDYLPLSGGTVTGNTIFNSGLTANTLNVTGNTILSGLTAETISATTYYNYPDTFVTGFTLSSNTITLTQNRTDGYSSFTISLSAYTGTSISGLYLPLSGGTVTGGTIFQSGVTANTISEVNYVNFDTTPSVPNPTGGTLYYDSGENALSYKPLTNQNDVTVNLGQESLIRIYNNLGYQINNGQVLHITGATDGVPTVALANASKLGTTFTEGLAQSSGVATHNIPNEEYGFMTNFGVVRDLNTTAFTVGQEVFLSDTVDGGLTNSPDNIAFTSRVSTVGYCLVSNATTGKILVSITNENPLQSLTQQEVNVLLGNTISTGAYFYTGATTASTTTINVSPMRGWIVFNTYEYSTNPLVLNVYYSGGTNIPITNITTSFDTYFLVNSGGTLYQQTTYPTPQERRNNIFLGRVVHPNKSTILNVEQSVDYDVSPLSSLRDLWVPLKLINEGVVPSYSGANLSFKTSSGTFWGNGIGWPTDELNPNAITVSAYSPAPFYYTTQTGGTFTTIETEIDTTKYDVGGVITAVPGTGNFTTQRIFMSQSGVIRVQYGQAEYSTLAKAIAAIPSETFVINPDNSLDCILIGLLTVKDGTGDLSNPDDAIFTFVSKFGEILGGTGGISTTTLQQAYNNSIPPEITTNSTLGALSIKNGAGADNVSNVIEGLNSGGAITAFIRADGLISGSSVSAPTISATTYENVNAVTGGTYNVTTGVITLSGTGSVNGNQITGFSTGGGGLTWNNSTTTQSASVDNGYVGTATTLTTITLPSTAAFGSIVEVVGTGTGLWRISQNVNQFINFGVATTTTGTGGYLSATSQYDCVKLLCTSADTAFVVTSAIGNIFYI